MDDTSSSMVEFKLKELKVLYLKKKSGRVSGYMWEPSVSVYVSLTFLVSSRDYVTCTVGSFQFSEDR